jgi:hypothetical protein
MTAPKLEVRAIPFGCSTTVYLPQDILPIKHRQTDKGHYTVEGHLQNARRGERAVGKCTSVTIDGQYAEHAT